MKSSRRGSMEGSIYQRQDGRWCALVSLGYKPGGQRHRKTLYGKTRAEVSAALKPVLRDQQLGKVIGSERQTVAMFLAHWLENTVKPKNRHLTYRSYEWIVRTHLIPSLGRIPIAKLTPQILQAFINERHATGLSAGTVKHINATLRAALSQAQKWGLVYQNAAKLITLPSCKRYEGAALSPAHAKQFLAHIRGHRHEALYTVALTMGLRRGEVVALRWSDIDLESASLKVTHSMERVKGKGLRLCEPKSVKARRDLRIPYVCLTALKSQVAVQEKQRQWAGNKWLEAGFVFTGGVGTPVIPDLISKELPAVLVAANLPKVRLSDLRHSCASLLLTLGVAAKLVQETLGHSTYQLTMDTYSHMIPALRNEVADRMDEIFDNSNRVAVNLAVKPAGVSI